MEDRVIRVKVHHFKFATTKTYTYDSANRLGAVSREQGVESSYSYNGLGDRLSQTVNGVTTQYVMDTSTSLSAGGDHPLSADSAGDTTFYLYGLGPIAEQNDAWTYSLPDGTNTPRQLTDASGEVTLAVRYTPWGDTLETYGTGNFAFGYFGGLMDTATGLLYIGNGQYYDPLTGRFLTRGVNPENPNPYIPWNPLGAVIGPLGLLALVFGRRKKGSKVGTWLVLLLVGASVGVTLAGCGPGNPPSPTPTLPPPNVIIIPGPTPTPGPETPIPPTQMPTLCVEWRPDTFTITHYVTVREDDASYFKPNDEACHDQDPDHSCDVPLEVEGTMTYQTPPVWHFYIGNDPAPGRKEWSVYWNGSGELHDPASLAMSGGKQFVQTRHYKNDNGPTNPYTTYHYSASYYFSDQPLGACGYPLNANATIAVPAGELSLIPGYTTEEQPFACGDEYYIDIPGFEGVIFTVADTGSYVNENNKEHFDIYAGVQYHDAEQSLSAKYDHIGDGGVRVAKVQP